MRNIVWHVPLGRAKDINFQNNNFIMNDQPRKIQRKKRKSYNIVGHAHELTFSCYHQNDYLNNPICCKLFLFDKMCINIVKKKVFRFWQAGGGFDRNLWNAKAIHSSINYIEANPVRAGLVENPEDWKWSSARVRRYKEGLVPDNYDIPVLMKS